MADVLVREPTIADLVYIAGNLRQADKDEVAAAWGGDVLPLLLHSLTHAHRIYVMEREGRPISVFGTSPMSLLTGTGCLWLLGTDEMAKIPKALTRIAHAHIAEVGDLFPHLMNYVDARNDDSIRWLQHIGATLGEPEPWGPFGLPFRRFDIGSPHVH